jgi:hypothetical protein
MIQSIPTMYNGIYFRSRLEARWAAIFDLLRWPWTYEPFDLKNYIPDFILTFEHHGDVLVEIKPFVRFDQEVWKHPINKINASGWSTKDGEGDLLELPALILGATIFSQHDDYDVTYDADYIGYFRDGSWWSCDPSAWNKACILECSECHGVFPCADGGERRCRRCNADSRSNKPFPIAHYWNHVKNATQWGKHAAFTEIQSLESARKNLESERQSLENEHQNLIEARQNLVEEQRCLAAAREETKDELRRLKNEWVKTKARIEAELLEEQIQKIISKRAERELVAIQTPEIRRKWYSMARDYAKKLIKQQRSEQQMPVSIEGESVDEG